MLHLIVIKDYYLLVYLMSGFFGFCRF